MITKELLLELPIGYVLHHRFASNADGTPERWRINGKVKTWKRQPNRFQVPVKYGLRDYGYITENETHHFCITAEEVYQDRAIKKFRNFNYDRKPLSFDEVSSKVNGNEIAHDLQYIPDYTAKDLFELDGDPHPLYPFVNPPETSIFVYRCKNGKEFLCDTQGYEYMRYLAQIL